MDTRDNTRRCSGEYFYRVNFYGKRQHSFKVKYWSNSSCWRKKYLNTHLKETQFSVKWHLSISQGFQLFISPWMDVPHVWGHNSETKAQIKNPKTCGPPQWTTLANGVSYSCGRSVSIEKPRYKRRVSLSLFCFI